MVAIVLAIFIIGYLAIVFEHPLKLDKTVPALLMGSLCWAAVSLMYHTGTMEVIDTHDHIFSMAGGMNEENEEG